jgi:hypothetical protein
MIRAAAIPVLCDGRCCGETVLFPLELLPSEPRGDVAEIHRWLIEQDWIIRDGQQFCGVPCANLPDPEKWRALPESCEAVLGRPMRLREEPWCR